MDSETQKLVNELRRLETRVYFILLLGYFRSRPIIFNFSFEDVVVDLDYVRTKYFNGKDMMLTDLPRTTKTKLFKKLLSYTGFSNYHSKVDKELLLKRLNDVVKINLEPRYVFDECIAYFGQNRIALAGYTTLQDTISTVLSNERSRIEHILTENLTQSTKAILLKLLESNSTFTDLAKLKRMAKDFSASQIAQELKTHKTIRLLYPEIKVLIAELKLSPKNLEYYASLVKHKTVYKLRRHDDSQTILYLVCYLFFRYRETNDNLVSAFIYMIRKLTESAKGYAKQRIVEDVNIVRTKLKSAGSLLKYFIDAEMDDGLSFGDVRKKAFKLIPADSIKLLSDHLDNNDFDGRQYEWQFIDKQSSKIKKLIRSLFMSIDIEFIHLKDELREQYIKAHEELTAFKTIKTINLDVVSKSEREYIDLVVIDQSIDTATPTGRLMFNMLAAIAEFETDLRSERQLEGIAKAKEHGVKFGRPTKRTAERDLEIYNKREKGISIGFLAKEYDLGSATIYRILNDVLEKVSTEATKLSS